MKQIIINSSEKVTSEDLTAMSTVGQQVVFDELFYSIYDATIGFIGKSLKPSIVGPTSVSINAGAGFIYDGTMTGTLPKYRIVYKRFSSNFDLTPDLPTVGNLRYGLIHAKPVRTVTLNASRQVKNQVTQQVSTQVVEKNAADLAEVEILWSAPHATLPLVPDIPAGSLGVAIVKVDSTGIIKLQDYRSIISEKRDQILMNVAGEFRLAQHSANYYVDCTAGNISLTLPIIDGIEVNVKRIDNSANVLTLLGTIEGEDNPTIEYQYTGRAFIMFNGSYFWSK